MVFVRKRESSQEENETWKAYTNRIWTINLSRDDPARINLCIQCIITYKYLKVLTSVLTKKIYILPFLTAAQRKHVQNTCNENV